MNLLGKNIRTSRLAKISTIIQKDPELRDNLKDARIIVYVNACRGREYEELADLEFDSSIGNIQTAETDNISKQLSKEWIHVINLRTLTTSVIVIQLGLGNFMDP